MGIEYSPQRRKRNKRRAQRNRDAITQGGVVSITTRPGIAELRDWISSGCDPDTRVRCPRCTQPKFGSAFLHPVRGPRPTCRECRTPMRT